MKKFLFALLCVLLTAGFALAVDVDLKGMYYARGSYIRNNDGLQGDTRDRVDYFYFDHELDATARLLVTDKTRIIINFEIHDEDWLSSPTDGAAEDRDADMDDNIEFKRVFSTHTFDAYGTVLDLGLMTGAAWHTGFGDNANGYYRVKITQPTAIGPVIGVYQKNAELGKGNGDLEDSEKDDDNSYVLAMVTKLGPVNLYPLIAYRNNSAAILDQGNDSQDTVRFILGGSGTHGDFGWEAEFDYIDTDNGDLPGDVDDFKRWGIYGNGWMNIGAGKVGLLAAYGSWDDDSGNGYGMGEDFTPTIYGADWTNIGGSDADGGNSLSEYKAVTMIQLYGSLALSEELSIFGSGLYWTSNADEESDGTDAFWKDADGYEIDLGLDWKLTDQVKYTVAGAFGKIKLDSDNVDAIANGDKPDSFARIYHRFRIDF